MISLDPPMSATNGSANAHGGQSESQSGSWLFELERAWLNSEKGRNGASQPSADSRAEPSAGASEGTLQKKSGEMPREGSSTGVTDSRSLKPMAFGPAESASNPQFDSRVSAVFASVRQALEVSLPASSLPADGKTANIFTGMMQATSAYPEALEQSPFTVTKDGSSKADEPSAQSDASYPEKRLHLLEDEHGVRVWIRDAALSEARGCAVANALRAELGMAGLRLVAVALNGKEITGDGKFSVEPGTASLEADFGYVQNMIDESNVSIEKLSQKEHS